jgi:uncharacterized protein YdeI (BOF family)
MKKFTIAFAALVAVSTAALAAGSSVKFEGDHAFYPPKTISTHTSASTVSVSPLKMIDLNGVGTRVKSRVVGAIDEHTDAFGFSR